MKKKCVFALLIPIFGLAQQTITGYVYEDANKNLKRDRLEKGISNVAVSNGEEVVVTDSKGKYVLPIRDNQTVFVIKPVGYTPPVNENNLPQFYYNYRPKGTSSAYKYKGISPSGKLPKEVSFALYSQKENKDFNIMVFGDPQPYNEKELDYFRRGIVNEAKNNKKNAVLGISLGDLVGDNLNLHPKYAGVIKEMGLPWYSVMGNHDMNYDAKEDQYSDETFRSNFGPNNYAFNYANVHFIVLDNILYPDPRDGKGYWGGFREDQLKFIENDLKTIDKNKLVVVSFHIPLIQDENNFREADRQKFISLLNGFQNVLLMSAHTHLQQQLFYGKKDGWNGLKPLYEFNAGTTSGDWYSGTVDSLGVPMSTMRDGTQRGYSYISFKDNQYQIQYKVAGKSENYQIKLHLPKVIPHKSKNTSRIVANFFMGSEKSTVQYRIDGGEWKEMDYTENPDPDYVLSVLKWDTTDELFPGRRPSNPEVSKHLWSAAFPKNLDYGKHTVEVKATDMFGNECKETGSFEVKDAAIIP